MQRLLKITRSKWPFPKYFQDSFYIFRVLSIDKEKKLVKYDVILIGSKNYFNNSFQATIEDTIIHWENKCHEYNGPIDIFPEEK